MTHPASKTLLIGIDEAGYGPNLGPLVIGCSAWLIDPSTKRNSIDTPLTETLLERLAPHFLPRPIKPRSSHVPLGDSKAIYASGDPLSSLEMGVRYWLRHIGTSGCSFQSLLEALRSGVRRGDFEASLVRFTWYGRCDRKQGCRFFGRRRFAIASSSRRSLYPVVAAFPRRIGQGDR